MFETRLLRLENESLPQHFGISLLTDAIVGSSSSGTLTDESSHGAIHYAGTANKQGELL
jgi:hypothetical protein